MAELIPAPLPLKTAFISGHTDLTQAQFDAHYLLHINTAIQQKHHFILSDAAGADTFALSYLLSQIPQHPYLASRITVYASNTSQKTKLEIQGLKVVSEDEIRSRGLDARVTKGLGKRTRHIVRDAHMTRDSDYDILWARTDEEAKEMYGKKWRPRVSATEMNRLRRIVEKEKEEESGG